MRVAVIQQHITPDPEENLRRSERLLRQAAAGKARLALLPELHCHRYFCQQEHISAFDLAEPVPGPTSDRLGALAAELGMVIVGSVFEKRAEGICHNTAVVLDSDGSLAGRYRKMHIPDDPGFHEKFYFTPGDMEGVEGQSGFSPISTSVGRLGVLVCWDQWYPEAARLMALSGAQILLYPAAIGWDRNDSTEEQTRQLDAWITVQRGHAVANLLPVLVANRTGFESSPVQGPGIQFWGKSFVCGPQGEQLATGSDEDDTVLLADLDLERSGQLRRIWPFFRDRRVDAYHGLLRRYRD